MNKVVMTALFALQIFSAQKVNAQAELTTPEQSDFKKNEVQISIGSQWFLNDITCDPDEYDNYSPSFSLGYMRNVNPKWSFGAQLSYIYNKEKKYYFADVYERYNYNIISLLGTVKGNWARHKYWNMYSRLAVGPAMIINKHIGYDTDVNPGISFQITPIAIEFGNNKLKGFFELGFGAQGIINAGVSHRF